MTKTTTMLMILDGFGCNPEKAGNAIAAARTPNLDALWEKYPHCQLGASGASVGLPDGQMGNSEVGHLNIGAGRIIYQDLSRITRAVADHSFFENEVLVNAVDAVKEHGALHLMGLLSDGGVHSHIDHLFALLDMAADHGVPHVYVHCFLDGRDVPPSCALTYIEQLEDKLQACGGNGKIATISGRYYAMDRDKRWERLELAYDALTAGTGRMADSPEKAIRTAYEQGETDEFVRPTVIRGTDGIIRDGDSVIMFNFRPDRAREITHALCDPDFGGFARKKHPDHLTHVCMTEYETGMPNTRLAYPPEHYTNTLGEYVSSLGMTQLRLAETEKYAHVTFFMNGGVEEPNPMEDRLLIPSPKVATYDLQPEMSAYPLHDKAVEALKSRKYDLIIINFANPDMVGHTGVFDAAVAAIEAVDKCVGDIEKTAEETGASLFITADHGNADTMIDEQGKPITKHSTNPVPAIVVLPPYDGSPSLHLREGGVLADIAPTLLEIMHLPQPAEMTGKSILIK